MLSPMAAAELPAWAQETQSPFYMPMVGSYSPPAAAGLGVAVEGSAMPLALDTQGVLPAFNRAVKSRHFIDVYNTGSAALTWTATASAPWVVLSRRTGRTDARIDVSIDWSHAPHGHAVPASITISGAGAKRVVQLSVFNPSGLDLASLPAAVENNGRVLLEAEDYVARHDSSAGVGWRRLSRASASGDGMTIQPVTAAGIDPVALGADTPSLTYQFQTFTSGVARVTVKCLPTHRITSDHAGVRYAVSLNGGPPQVIDLQANEYSAAWNANVLRAWSAGVSQHRLAAAGRQTLTIQMIDPGVVLDRIEVEVSTPAP